MPISKPDVTLNIIPAEQLATVEEQKVLIVGQMLTGTATAGEISYEVDDATNAINALFGARSIVADMVRGFKEYNKLTRLDVLPLDDNGSAVDATAIVAFSGTATEDGTITVTFGSDERYKVEIDVLTDDTATEIGAAVETAYAAYTSSPFTVGASTGTVTATASNGGTHANDWTVLVDGTVAGVTYTVTGWTGGANDPTLTGVLDVLGDTRYQTVVWPAVYDIETIGDVLDDRFNTNNDVLDGIAVQVKKGTLSSLKSYTSPLNSQSIVVIGDKTVSETYRDGTALREIPDNTAAQFAALRSLRLTEDGNLTQYMTTTASLDQFGGVAIASIPYFNTALTDLPVPRPQDEFSAEDQSELNDNAVSLIGANRAYNGTVMGEMVTTYLTDNAGNSDSSYKFLNTVDTMSAIRETFYANYKAKYAQTRLTSGDLITGRDMANVESISAFSLEVYKSLATSGLVQAGSEAERDFLSNLIISLDLSSGTATITMAPLLVSQLRVIVGTIQVNFGG